MADIQIEAATTGNQRNVQRHVVFISATVGYIFFTDSGNDLAYRKTDDGGATWGAAVVIHATSFVGQLDIWYDRWTPGDTGTVIHMFYGEIATDEIWYDALDTADDSLHGRIIIEASGLITNGRAGATISGTKSVGGTLYSQFWGHNAGMHGFYESTDGGDNWVELLDGADGDATDNPLLLPDGNAADTDDILMLYEDRSAQEITLKKYDNSANTWSESASLTAHASNSGFQNWDATYRESDDHVILVHSTTYDAATADLNVIDITVSDSSGSDLGDIFSNVNDWALPRIYIDQDNDDLYVAYLGQSDGASAWLSAVDCHYQLSTDGGSTWGGELTFSVNAADDHRAMGCGHGTPGTGPGLFCPVWNNDDFDDILTNSDNAVITGGAGGSPADPIPDRSLQVGTEAVRRASVY